MFVNYFIADGKKYYTGTVFIIKEMSEQVEATFICYNTETKYYVYKINECTWHRNYESFCRNFVAVTNKRDSGAHMPVEKTLPDRHIDGLLLGWLWYIFLMAIATIFKGNVVLWILISVVFFDWRKKKKKEGTYIEW